MEHSPLNVAHQLIHLTGRKIATPAYRDGKKLRVSFIEKDSPIPTKQLLQSVIDGKNVDQIWQSMGLSPAPDMLFFLANPSAGESITMIGIAIGVSSVVPATFLSAYFLKKSRNPVFAILAILSGLLTCVAMTGIIL